MKKTLTLLALAILAMAYASHTYANTYAKAIEVKHGASTDDKLRIAKSIATEERFARLKAQLRERFPSLTARQLDGLGLRWNVRHFTPLTGQRPHDRVTVIALIEYDGSFDPKPIIEAATKILEPEVNPVVPASNGNSR